MATAMSAPDISLLHQQAVFEKARLSRDPRFDGQFFIGVKTTGIYCRPVCPVKLPKAVNVTFFSTAAAAMDKGFRPCLRCRPEASPGTPAWAGTSTTVSRGIKLIAEGALDEGDVNSLAERLGVGSRHLSRLFQKHLGASPRSVAQARRLHFAKRLIDESSLKMSDIALSAGYRSIRRFNDHFKSVYQLTPSQLRAKQKGSVDSDCGVQFKLNYRPPFDWQHLSGFLQMRASPGIECVTGGSYSRTFRTAKGSGYFSVRQVQGENALTCRIKLTDYAELLVILERIKSVFDLTADPQQIRKGLLQHEGKGGLMHQLLAKFPVTRIPGGWDGFEIAVRAIVGQQVSVRGATTVMGRLVQSYGEQNCDSVPVSQLESYFPSPSRLAKLDTSALSMPRARAQAIKDMATAVSAGDIDFNVSSDVLVNQLKSIKGIGDWTAQYVAMRASSDPDAFLGGDLVLRKVASRLSGRDLTVRQLEQMAEQWRPWRAYAGMLLWRAAV
jgi:AraC family transcriptional regulator of adaptative response / DNA-3-methyladenine glycosylase II